jgi:hypothetical protein
LSQEDDVLKAVVASPFISYSVNELDKKNFVNYISINMGWVAPRVVDDILKLAFLHGFIEEIDDRIRITIDTRGISMKDFNPQRIEDVIKSSRRVLDMFSLIQDPYEASLEFRELETRYAEYLYEEAIMLLILRKRDIEYNYSLKEQILKKD